MKNYMKKYFTSILTVLTVLLAKLIPFSFIVGSWGAYFSWSTIIVPALALHAGLGCVFLFFIPLKKIALTSLLLFAVYKSPLFFAAWAYRYPRFESWVILPIICMTLFIVHDVGGQAWPYALYWLIPVALWFIKKSSWTKALSAVFIAHCVGSVIWLYTHDISAMIWMGLIPIVAKERFLMMLGIVAFDFFIVGCRVILSKAVRFNLLRRL